MAKSRGTTSPKKVLKQVWGPFWLEKMKTVASLLYLTCLRDQTYSCTAPGSRAGQQSGHKLKPWVREVWIGGNGWGKGVLWWDFFSLPLSLLSPCFHLSRVGAGQCWGEGLPSGQLLLDLNSCGRLLHLLAQLVTRAQLLSRMLQWALQSRAPPIAGDYHLQV